jgi:glyoxylase I family protein
MTTAIRCIRRLENAGVPCESVRLDAYTGKPMTFFRDPDGLPIEIHE